MHTYMHVYTSTIYLSIYLSLGFAGTAWTCWSPDIDTIRSSGVPTGGHGENPWGKPMGNPWENHGEMNRIG